MNKNVENYKKAMDKVEADEKLREKTFHVVQNNNNNKNFKINLKQLIAACATFVVVVSAGAIFYNNSHISGEDSKSGNAPILAHAQLPKFESIDQLKEELEKNNNDYGYRGEMIDALTNSASVQEAEIPTGQSSDGASTKRTTDQVNYSKTNVQVENVDEADIVKTDGKNIYYVTSNKVVIIDAEKLVKLSEITIEYDKNKSSYVNVSEIFMKDNKVVLLGSENVYEEPETENEKDPNVRQYGESEVETFKQRTPTYYRKSYQLTTARVYDITDKANPKLERTVGIEGYYNTARLIEDNLYLIANKSIYYYRNSEIKDDDLLPRVLDTAKSENIFRRSITDISYIKDCYNHSYLMIVGFNIKDKKEATFESVLGASEEVYASEKNLYVTDSIYNYGILINEFKSKIFKFNLDNGTVRLVATGEVPGAVHDQFSIDEYNGYLRIATTGENILGGDTNNLIVLDENLQKVGEINGIAVGEEIKSVRFVGKVGYIVTFKQIDPLFIVDLSNPENPRLRGELKIPGYSAYLHPYDETHIIGIGNNTDTNKYGNTVNTNMKMSMFDVSDLDNPKEIFSVDIGTSSAYSEITYNHKALFYYKEKDLIGFPVTTYGDTYSNRKAGFEIYKIDLKQNEFKKFGELKKSDEYWNMVRRIIYIGDYLYSLTSDNVTKYNLETAEEKGSLTISNTSPMRIYEDYVEY